MTDDTSSRDIRLGKTTEPGADCHRPGLYWAEPHVHATPQSLQALAEEDLANLSFIDSGNHTALRKAHMPVPGLRLRFVHLR